MIVPSRSRMTNLRFFIAEVGVCALSQKGTAEEFCLGVGIGVGNPDIPDPAFTSVTVQPLVNNPCWKYFVLDRNRAIGRDRLQQIAIQQINAGIDPARAVAVRFFLKADN